jgi:predicted permease
MLGIAGATSASRGEASDVGEVWWLWVAFLTILLGGAAVIWLATRLRRPSRRTVGDAAMSTVAASLVFGAQSSTVGPGIDGGVLSLAAGAITLLALLLFRSF